MRLSNFVGLGLIAADVTILQKQSMVGVNKAGKSLVLTCSGGEDLEWIGPNGFPITSTNRYDPIYIQKYGSSKVIIYIKIKLY